MRIRIIKVPPAPLMDGFDVRQFLQSHVYDVDTRLAHYLIVAGYAIPERRSIERADDKPDPRERK